MRQQVSCAKSSCPVTALVICAVANVAFAATGSDRLLRDGVTRTETQANLGSGYTMSCNFIPPTQTITFAEAIARAMCFNSSTKQAWLAVEDKAAQYELARAQYFPQVSAQATDGIARGSASDATDPYFDSRTQFRHPRAEIDIALTLIDFGLHAASIEGAKAALASAFALNDDALRNNYVKTGAAYFELLRADNAVKSNSELLGYARFITEIVEGRFSSGASPITEKLQADAAYAELALKQKSALGDAETARGTLASQMGLSPSVHIVISERLRLSVDESIPRSAAEVLDAVLRTDAKVASARFDLVTAEADARAARVRDLPKISLNATSSYQAQAFYGRNNYSIVQAPSNNQSRNSEINLQITVPITDLVTRRLRVRSAEANVLTKSRELDVMQQQSSMDARSAYQTYLVSVQSLEELREIENLNVELYEAAKGRYSSGAGPLTDVLNAQRDLESAHVRQLDTLLDLRIARLTLLASMGRINLLENP